MKRLLFSAFLLLLLACNPTETMEEYVDSVQSFNAFNASRHLKPEFDQAKFDTLHGWEFGWELLEPINVAPNREAETDLAEQLSPGQKALYFIWYLDAEVTNGGFIQFYWNGNRRYLSAIKNGLKLTGDEKTLLLVEQADKEYIQHKEKFLVQREKDDWSPLYDNLESFGRFDETYYEIHEKMMELIEQYARLHPEEFVELK